ncbi:MAG: hypothetical protein RPU43_00555 [Candidatus Sedimenticola sp. (ex Thyasira tokunagai)]
MRYILTIITFCVAIAGCDVSKAEKNKEAKLYADRRSECDKRESFDYRRKVDLIDVGQKLNKQGLSYEWKIKRKVLGDTCYQVVAGSYVYKKEGIEYQDFYTFGVEVRQGFKDSEGKQQGMWVVLYRRDIDAGNLPSGFSEKRIDDFVNYNEAFGTVTFDIGSETYTYELPRP